MSAPTGPAVDEDVLDGVGLTTGTLVKPMPQSSSALKMRRKREGLKCVTMFTIRGFLSSVHSTITQLNDLAL